jgi:hypothetical protein
MNPVRRAAFRARAAIQMLGGADVGAVMQVIKAMG